MRHDEPEQPCIEALRKSRPDIAIRVTRTNLQGPDPGDGTYDCLDCGIWFTEDAAEVVEERK